MSNKRRFWRNQAGETQLEFSTVKTALNGKTVYRGVLKARPKVATERFAEELERLGCPVDRRTIEMVLGFIADYAPYIAGKAGGRVEIGPFTVYPSLEGGFDAPDAEFDPRRNRIALKVSPRMAFRYTTKGLRLRNVMKDAMEAPALLCVGMNTSSPGDEENVLRTGATGVAIGANIGIEEGRADEGVALAKGGGAEVACAVVESMRGFAEFAVPAGLAPGAWELRLRCRASREPGAAPYVLRRAVHLRC